MAFENGCTSGEGSHKHAFWGGYVKKTTIMNNIALTFLKPHKNDLWLPFQLILIQGMLLSAYW